MKFPWVLIFDLVISNFKIVAHNFAEFPGVERLVFSRISKGNATNLKFSNGAFQKGIPLLPPPRFGVFLESTSEEIANRGGGLKT